MIKKILCIIISIVIILSLGACSFQNPIKPKEPKPPQSIIFETNEGFANFDTQFINFLDNEFANNSENYVASPLSLKYALCLATIGANGETQKELLDLMDFKNIDECINWAESYNYELEKFKVSAYEDKSSRTLHVANSVWHNSDKKGKLLPTYVNTVNDKLLSQVYCEKGNKLPTKINDWCKKETNGLIYPIVTDTVSDANTVIVNTVYLKTNWKKTFTEELTKKDYFTTIQGEKVEKDFMTTQGYFSYYKDNETELVVLPLEGDINCVFVMGKDSGIIKDGQETNFYEKIKQAELTDVNLRVPKFEINSSFNNNEIANFLSENGAHLCFDKNRADFSNMIDEQIYINKIIQKTKIETDEEGVEAASATAIIMEDNATNIDSVTHVSFDKPFKFYIYNFNNNNPEILFYGNYLK